VALKTPGAACDFAKAVAGMQTEEINTRRQAAMKYFFVPLKTGMAETSLRLVEQVFHLA